MCEFKFLKFQIWWLELLGLWSFKPRYFTKWLYTCLILLLQVMIMLSCFTNLIKCNGKLNCSVENAATTVMTIAAVYSYLIFLVRENHYKAVVTKLYETVNQFDTYMYSNPAEQTSKKYAVVLTVYLLIGLLEYAVAPILDYSNCLERDNTDSAMTCGLLAPGSFPFDSQNSPGYEVAFVFQSVSASLCILPMAHMIAFCLSATYHAIVQLKMLKDNLQQICNSKAEKRCDLLSDCVQHHISIIDLSEQVALPLNEFLVVHAILMAVILTVNGFQIMQMILTTGDIWSLIHFVLTLFGFLVTLFVMSAIGQMLIDQSMEVADFAYNVPWYDESLEFQRMILFIILRSQKPLVLRSASISELSFASFAKVMSSTYSYLTLLYNTVLATEIYYESNL